MKFKIEDRFVNDYICEKMKNKKEIQNRKQESKIKNEIEIGFLEMFDTKKEEYSL